jgi:TRAP-type C4-dicarboxylate transport system permease small subunit
MITIWEGYLRIVKIISKAGLAGAGLMVVLMLVCINFDVVGRWVFGSTFLDATELSGYFLVFLVFASVAYTFMHGGFIRVQFIYNKVPEKYRNWLEVLLTLLAFGYSSVLFKYFWVLIFQSVKAGTRSIGTTRILLQYPQMIMGIGAGILLLALIAHLGQRFRIIWGNTSIADIEDEQDDDPVVD